MQLFTICVDMDDTIENLLSAWLIYLNKKYKRSITLNDINDWSLNTVYPDLTDAQIFQPLYSRSFWKTVCPKMDAVEYLRKLKEDGHKIYICTCSHYKTLRYKVEEVLLEYFPYLDWRDIIVAHDKQIIKCDIFVDDGPHNLENGDYIKLLMHAPHNKNYNDKANNMIRVYNWAEIYNLISSMSVMKDEN